MRVKISHKLGKNKGFTTRMLVLGSRLINNIQIGGKSVFNWVFLI